jgi:hypothetical protein
VAYAAHTALPEAEVSEIVECEKFCSHASLYLLYLIRVSDFLAVFKTGMTLGLSLLIPQIAIT